MNIGDITDKMDTSDIIATFALLSSLLIPTVSHFVNAHTIKKNSKQKAHNEEIDKLHELLNKLFICMNAIACNEDVNKNNHYIMYLNKEIRRICYSLREKKSKMNKQDFAELIVNIRLISTETISKPETIQNPKNCLDEISKLIIDIKNEFDKIH